MATSKTRMNAAMNKKLNVCLAIYAKLVLNAILCSEIVCVGMNKAMLLHDSLYLL